MQLSLKTIRLSAHNGLSSRVGRCPLFPLFSPTFRPEPLFRSLRLPFRANHASSKAEIPSDMQARQTHAGTEGGDAGPSTNSSSIVRSPLTDCTAQLADLVDSAALLLGIHEKSRGFTPPVWAGHVKGIPQPFPFRPQAPCARRLPNSFEGQQFARTALLAVVQDISLAASNCSLVPTLDGLTSLSRRLRLLSRLALHYKNVRNQLSWTERMAETGPRTAALTDWVDAAMRLVGEPPLGSGGDSEQMRQFAAALQAMSNMLGSLLPKLVWKTSHLADVAASDGKWQAWRRTSSTSSTRCGGRLATVPVDGSKAAGGGLFIQSEATAADLRDVGRVPDRDQSHSRGHGDSNGSEAASSGARTYITEAEQAEQLLWTVDLLDSISLTVECMRMLLARSKADLRRLRLRHTQQQEQKLRVRDNRSMRMSSGMEGAFAHEHVYGRSDDSIAPRRQRPSPSSLSSSWEAETEVAAGAGAGAGAGSEQLISEANIEAAEGTVTDLDAAFSAGMRCAAHVDSALVRAALAGAFGGPIAVGRPGRSLFRPRTVNLRFPPASDAQLRAAAAVLHAHAQRLMHCCPELIDALHDPIVHALRHLPLLRPLRQSDGLKQLESSDASGWQSQSLTLAPSGSGACRFSRLCFSDGVVLALLLQAAGGESAVLRSVAMVRVETLSRTLVKERRAVLDRLGLRSRQAATGEWAGAETGPGPDRGPDADHTRKEFAAAPPSQPDSVSASSAAASASALSSGHSTSLSASGQGREFLLPGGDAMEAREANEAAAAAAASAELATAAAVASAGSAEREPLPGLDALRERVDYLCFATVATLALLRPAQPRAADGWSPTTVQRWAENAIGSLDGLPGRILQRFFDGPRLLAAAAADVRETGTSIGAALLARARLSPSMLPLLPDFAALATASGILHSTACTFPMPSSPGRGDGDAQSHDGHGLDSAIDKSKQVAQLLATVASVTVQSRALVETQLAPFTAMPRAGEAVLALRSLLRSASTADRDRVHRALSAVHLLLLWQIGATGTVGNLFPADVVAPESALPDLASAPLAGGDIAGTGVAKSLPLPLPVPEVDGADAVRAGIVSSGLRLPRSAQSDIALLAWRSSLQRHQALAASASAAADSGEAVDGMLSASLARTSESAVPRYMLKDARRTGTVSTRLNINGTVGALTLFGRAETWRQIPLPSEQVLLEQEQELELEQRAVDGADAEAKVKGKAEPKAKVESQDELGGGELPERAPQPAEGALVPAQLARLAIQWLVVSRFTRARNMRRMFSLHSPYQEARRAASDTAHAKPAAKATTSPLAPMTAAVQLVPEPGAASCGAAALRPENRSYLISLAAGDAVWRAASTFCEERGLLQPHPATPFITQDTLGIPLSVAWPEAMACILVRPPSAFSSVSPRQHAGVSIGALCAGADAASEHGESILPELHPLASTGIAAVMHHRASSEAALEVAALRAAGWTVATIPADEVSLAALVEAVSKPNLTHAELVCRLVSTQRMSVSPVALKLEQRLHSVGMLARLSRRWRAANGEEPALSATAAPAGEGKRSKRKQARQQRAPAPESAAGAAVTGSPGYENPESDVSTDGDEYSDDEHDFWGLGAGLDAAALASAGLQSASPHPTFGAGSVLAAPLTAAAVAGDSALLTPPSRGLDSASAPALVSASASLAGKAVDPLADVAYPAPSEPWSSGIALSREWDASFAPADLQLPQLPASSPGQASLTPLPLRKPQTREPASRVPASSASRSSVTRASTASASASSASTSPSSSPLTSSSVPSAPAAAGSVSPQRKRKVAAVSASALASLITAAGDSSASAQAVPSQPPVEPLSHSLSQSGERPAARSATLAAEAKAQAFAQAQAQDAIGKADFASVAPAGVAEPRSDSTAAAAPDRSTRHTATSAPAPGGARPSQGRPGTQSQARSRGQGKGQGSSSSRLAAALSALSLPTSTETPLAAAEAAMSATQLHVKGDRPLR